MVLGVTWFSSEVLDVQEITQEGEGKSLELSHLRHQHLKDFQMKETPTKKTERMVRTKEKILCPLYSSSHGPTYTKLLLLETEDHISIPSCLLSSVYCVFKICHKSGCLSPCPQQPHNPGSNNQIIQLPPHLS
jgi:hypothetical protein